jgi:BirA family transcriptional regulator, biotin operon repressor / biotin---[acetyl-CoA-carboxylase] ligase
MSWVGEPVENLRVRWGLPLLQVHDRVGSTNEIARRLAEGGAPQGSTVLADEQTGGRGRRGRTWIAPAGSSLLLSMVLRPRVPGAESVLSLRLGIAAALAIEAVAPVRVGLKWPNDLIVHDRKVAGILCESAGEPGRDFHLVAGIGINISQRDEDWPPELRDAASSLECRGGGPVDRTRLAGRLIAEWLDAARRDSPTLEADEMQEFLGRDVLRGCDLLIDGTAAGAGQGIDPDGALRVGAPGAARRVIAGTVRARDLQAGDLS